MTTGFWHEPANDDTSSYDPLYVGCRDDDEIRESLDAMWGRYRPYCGDTNFVGEAKRRFQQFTWQMYVGVCLLEAGHTLERAAPAGPDHSVLVDGRRVWVECIAPKVGEGDNRTERTQLTWTPSEGVVATVSTARRQTTRSRRG
jgi:hypothetical protein